MNIDYTGTLIASAASCAAFTVFLALFHSIHRGPRGVSWWTASSTLVTFSSILYSLRGGNWHGEAHYPPYLILIGIWCPGVWLCAAGGCMLQGFREILGLSGGLRVSAALLICQIIVFSALTYAWPSMNGRAFSIAIFLCGICLASAFTIHQHAEPEISTVARAGAGLFILLAAGYALRAFSSGRLLLSTEALPSGIDSRTTFLLSSAVNALWIVCGITIALKREKLIDTRKREEQSRTANQVKLETHRARLSRDIHDMFSGTLATIAILSSERMLPEETPDQLKRIHSLSSQGVGELRSLLNKLSAPESDLRRWGAELHEMAARLSEAAGLVLEFDSSGFDSRPLGEPLAGVNLRRAVQEAIFNSIRHAQPSRISISAIAGRESLRISVTDDGPGFPDKVTGGSGVSNMSSRTRDLGGSMARSSNPGATVLFDVPLPLEFCDHS